MFDEPGEKSGRSVEYDSENNRYLFDDDRSTSECSILSEFGWTTTTQNLHHHRQRFHYSIDDPFVDFAMEKSDASSVGGLEAPPALANMSSGLAELASISNPSVSSSSSDQDPADKSIGSVETPPPSLQIPNNNKKKGQKRIRQQRFAFVTKSDIDHLEDGYRWRKYGQKAVKNSPYPRSYYRCTNTKCTVKKRVERSYEDPAKVITTYEGQHCHQTVGFPRGTGGLACIREVAFGGQILGRPPNSQYYYPVMSMPQQSPQCSISPLFLQPVVDPASEPIKNNDQMIVRTEPQLPPKHRFIPSDEGLLGDIVSPPRLRNSHP